MSSSVQIRVDASRPSGRLEHHWNYTGYDECNYTHTPGGTALIGKIGSLEKPYYIRTHHLLCTGIRHGFYKWGSTNVYTEDRDGNPVYDFETIDRIIDIWLRHHCVPFLELGFMPKDLADPREAENGVSYRAEYGSVSEYRLRGWCQPPKDYGKWYDLIYRLAVHLRNRYGPEEVAKWYFEMWNEPDIFYWHGSPEEFFRLYDYTEAALHQALPSARFGGPATTGTDDPDGNASRFLRAFLEHTRSGVNYYSGRAGTRLDFTSFHTKGGNYRFDALAEKQPPSVRTFLENVRVQGGIIREYGYGDLECVLSEADPDGNASRFLRAFLEHTRSGVNYYSGRTGTRLDFTSFHTKGGNYRFDALAEKQTPSVRTFLANVRVQGGIIREYGYSGLECVLSEADPDGWAAGGRFDNFNLYFRNTEYYAAYVLSAYKNLFDLAEEMDMDFRPLAWAFQFEGERCFEGTRSLSTQGIDKPVFNLFRMLARLGTQRVELHSSLRRDPADDAEEAAEVDGWAVCDRPDRLQVLVYSHHRDWDRKETLDVSLIMENLPMEGHVTVTHYRIDRDHSNACTEWERLGRPDWPDEAQRAALASRSGLEMFRALEKAAVRGGRLEISFPLPVHGISLLEIVPTVTGIG